MTKRSVGRPTLGKKKLYPKAVYFTSKEIEKISKRASKYDIKNYHDLMLIIDGFNFYVKTIT